MTESFQDSKVQISDLELAVVERLVLVYADTLSSLPARQDIDRQMSRVYHYWGEVASSVLEAAGVVPYDSATLREELCVSNANELVFRGTADDAVRSLVALATFSGYIAGVEAQQKTVRDRAGAADQGDQRERSTVEHKPRKLTMGWIPTAGVCIIEPILAPVGPRNAAPDQRSNLEVMQLAKAALDEAIISEQIRLGILKPVLSEEEKVWLGSLTSETGEVS